MRAFTSLYLVLVAIALAGSGCASIGARTGYADAGIYPGVYPGPRNIIHEMETPRGAAHNILVWPCGIIDFPLSAALDTVLLPLDLPYWAYTRDSKDQSPTTTDTPK
jgi:uncharacterized protein YceK